MSTAVDFLQTLGLIEALNLAPVACAIVDTAGGVVLASSGARLLAGGQLPDAAEGGPRGEMRRPDGSPYPRAEWPIVRSLTHGQRVIDVAYSLIGPRGGRRVVRCSSAPVRDAAGAIVGAVLSLADVTAEKKDHDRLSYFDRLLANSDDAIVGTDADFRLTVWNSGAERLYGYAAGEVLGRYAREVATYEGDTARTGLEGDLLDTDHTRTEFTARRKDGSLVDVEMVAGAARDYRGEIVGYLGIHRDVTERRRASAALEAGAQRQAVIAELGLAALAEPDVEATLDAAVTKVARTLGVELATVTEILPDGDKIVLRAGAGWAQGSVGEEVAYSPDSMTGRVVTAGEPLLSEDVTADSRFRASPFLERHGIIGALLFPVGRRGDAFGALGAFAGTPRLFSSDDVHFMQAVANVISTTYEVATAERRLEEVRDAERRRIARDLHDETLQTLTRALAVARSAAPPPWRNVDELLQRAGWQVRAAIYDLRVGDEESRPLSERLGELVATQAAIAAGVRMEFDVADGAPDVRDYRSTEVVRIVSEAVINARRHADAATICVGVAGPADRLRIQVADDGKGFDPQASLPLRATGLSGARERAERIHAALVITSAPGEGTVVSLELPLADAGSHDTPVRILLVEDHATVRDAIAGMLAREDDFTIVGQAGSLAEARGMLEGVDVALIDLGLPDGSGDDLVRELREASPGADALVLTAGFDRAKIARAVANGAAGVLNKVAHLDDVVDAIRRLRAEETLLARDELAELISYDRSRRNRERADRQATERLTPRELEVLQALADGLGSEAIASRLHVTPRTERNHVANILAKLDVHTRLQAVVLGVRYGVVEIR